MNTTLTDILVCPECVPESRLVLLADRVEDGRVVDGTLGCPRCRARYPVSGGLADLRARSASRPVETEPEGVTSGPGQPRDAAVRLAALLGLGPEGGVVMIAGVGRAALANDIAVITEGIQFVTLGDAPGAGVDERAVSRIAAGPRLPFGDATLRAIALDGERTTSLFGEAARVLRPGGRLVVERAADDAAERIAAHGLRIRACDAGTLVAER